ncbi:MAG: isoprenylcysteine carboxylmethyltransferase family protein [Ruminococcus sp.]|nr:isoprenylcysteine carboxylmethyltransferase family protein [Ruminococcus sp.]
MNNKNHLPAIGVGPIIITPQIILTFVGIMLSVFGFFDAGKIAILKIPFTVIGIIIIVFGIYLWYCANFKEKVFDCITKNKLATKGVYSMVRNPIYSAFFLICLGAVLIANNLILFIIPVICWVYMTIFLKRTEEKWLLNLYGQEYIDYCKRVNRCIPWFPKK